MGQGPVSIVEFFADPKNETLETNKPPAMHNIINLKELERIQKPSERISDPALAEHARKLKFHTFLSVRQNSPKITWNICTV